MSDNAASERSARISAKPWQAKDFRLPDGIADVPGMLSNEEKRMLYYLARSEYSGAGAIIDLGAYLGGSTICLAAGARDAGLENVMLHSYDLFRLADFERKRYFPDAPSEFNARPVFDANLAAYQDMLIVHEGDVLNFPWGGGPIELLFIDIAKSHRVWDHLLAQYFPALIPERSLVVVQDYLWPETGPWHHVVMEKLANYFQYVTDTGINSVVFALTAPVPSEVLTECQWKNLTTAEKLELMDRAIGKLDTDEKRRALLANRAMIEDGRDLTWGMHYHSL